MTTSYFSRLFECSTSETAENGHPSLICLHGAMRQEPMFGRLLVAREGAHRPGGARRIDSSDGKAVHRAHGIPRVSTHPQMDGPTVQSEVSSYGSSLGKAKALAAPKVPRRAKRARGR